MIKPHTVREVLYVLGEPGGVQPGGFKTALYDAIAKADTDNQARLMQAFPAEVHAFQYAMTHGADALRDMFIPLQEDR